MTTSRFVIFSAVVVLLCAVSLSEGIRAGPQMCCFSFQTRPLSIKRLVNYSKTSQQCSTEAVVFQTVKDKLVCAKLTDSWVQKYMNIIDGKINGDKGPL